MRVKIIGSAAGGGFPQWNCACANCSALRSGNFPGKARTQAQVAISADGHSWFLLGASPDLRMQIEATPELHPRKGVRQSPIAGVVLASADIDHVVGLLSLRELQPLRIYATPSVLRILREGNSMFRMLDRVPKQAVWEEIRPEQNLELASAEGENVGLNCKILGLGTHFPAYREGVSDSAQEPQQATVGLIVQSRSGRRMAYMPAVPRIDDELLQPLDSADLLLFDGTFWSNDELIRVLGSGQTARQMGHVPVGPPDGSLLRLAELRRPRKIFVHINNTNPMLNESGPEFRMLREAGWELAEDGWQFEL
jgi:pyrroloquinoline quinone biosynthesis protein B